MKNINKLLVSVLAAIMLLTACTVTPQASTQPDTTPTEQTTEANQTATAPTAEATATETPTDAPTATEAPTPGITVSHEPVTEWDSYFNYAGNDIKNVILTRFNDGKKGNGTGIFNFTDDGLLIMQNNGAYADTYGIYSGANLRNADYSACKYVGISLVNYEEEAVLFGLQGSTKQNKSIFLKSTGSPIVLAYNNGKIYKAQGQGNVNARYCFSVPGNFEGCVLIPIDRIIDNNVDENGKPWNLSPINNLGFHMASGGQKGMLIRNLFICNIALDEPTNDIGEITYITNPDYSYTNKQRISAFWSNDTMYNESVTFIQQPNGEIYGTTLFVPSEILCVVNYAHRKEYKAGVDYEWVQGTNKIKWLNGSAIPYFFNGALLGKKEEGSSENVKEWDNAGFDSTGRARLGGVLYCVGEFIYTKQFCVTYKYDTKQIASQGIKYTQYQGDKLSRTVDKLNNNKDIKVLFYGDSIFSGCDASSLYGRAPYMPQMSQLIAEEMQTMTTGKVTMKNISIGGWTVENGLNALSRNEGGYDYSQAYQGYDLLILSFGMNNAGTSPASFKNTTKAIVDKMRTANPDMEVIYVSSMSPNPDSPSFYGNQKLFGAQLKALADADDHAAVVDFFAVHESILKYKNFASTTGNNINHPNDWLIRVYAQNILATFKK